MRDFFYHWKRIIEERLEDILSLANHLEPEHIRLLLNIQESTFCNALDIFESAGLGGELSVLSDSLYSLSESAKKVEKYCDSYYSNTKKFSEGHS